MPNATREKPEQSNETKKNEMLHATQTFRSALVH